MLEYPCVLFHISENNFYYSRVFCLNFDIIRSGMGRCSCAVSCLVVTELCDAWVMEIESV